MECDITHEFLLCFEFQNLEINEKSGVKTELLCCLELRQFITHISHMHAQIEYMKMYSYCSYPWD